MSYLNEMQFASAGFFEFMSIFVPYPTVMWQIFAFLLFSWILLNTHF